MEIEVKKLLERLPKRSFLGKGINIEQGYLVDGIRLRKFGLEYFMTVKGPGDLCREEWEVSIPEWVFIQLWPKTKGRRIRKIRYHVPFNEFVIDIDKFLGDLKGLYFLECEFKRVEDVKKFKTPDWVGRNIDVTKNKEYSNRSLAMKGLPKKWKAKRRAKKPKKP